MDQLAFAAKANLGAASPLKIASLAVAEEIKTINNSLWDIHITLEKERYEYD